MRHIAPVLAFALLCSVPAVAAEHNGAAGDSIAVGVGAALRVETFALKSMSSCWILKHEIPRVVAQGWWDHFVVSAGITIRRVTA